jgi:multidrug efflux pump subunit AcrA (membrane-fusion protein)
MVYYVDEEGMRAYKPVEIGIAANGMVEILSGLEEGETIILG